jgi:hypothetical protein
MGVGMVAPAALPAQSQITMYDKKLRMRSLLKDIYSKLEGLYNTKAGSIPNTIYMRVEEQALQGNTCVITMKKPLSAAAVYGNNVAIGNEELPTTKAVTLYRNNLRKVVSTPGYGTRELDAAPYRLYETHVDNLGDWNKEQEGLEIRQAFVERYGETLVHGDTTGFCARNWNPNIAVFGLPIRTMVPTYSANQATYTTNIITSVIAAGGGSILPTVGQTLNQPNMSNLSNLAMEKRITPLSIPGLPGGKGYILTISERQATYVGDPAWSQRNLGDAFRYGEPKEVMSWPGVIGSWKDLLIVVDPRQPTLVPTGSAAPFGLSAGFVWPGDIDERYRSDRDCCDTVFLLGQDAIAKWDAQKLHHITQDDDYGAVVGHGTARVWGVQLPVYDQQVPNMGSWEYFGGILGICRFPDYV